jgi:nitrogen-specific signal transduction histidine kinase
MGPAELAGLLLVAIEEEDYPNRALTVARTVSRAAGGRIWLLEPSDSRYHLAAEFGVTTLAQTPAGLAELLAEFPDPIPEWQVLASSRATMVAVRERETVRAVVELVGADHQLLDEAAALLQTTLMRHLQLRTAQRVLRALRDPINFTTGEDSFRLAVETTIQVGSGMEFGAVRLRQREANIASHELKCVALYGWDKGVDIEDWDIPDYRDVPTFSGAIDGGEVEYAPDRSDPGLEKLWAQNDNLSSVASFVVLPMTDGQETIGVLSVATSKRFDLTQFELDTLEAMAVNVGLAYSNRSSYHADLENAIDSVQLSSALNSLELVSAVSHQINSSLNGIPESLLTLKKTAERKGVDLAHNTDFDRLSELPRTIDVLMSQLRASTAIPSLTVESADIEKIWTEAVEIVWPRLQRLGCQFPRYDGPSELIQIMPDALRQVFFLLLLNSADAFKERERGLRDKRIILRNDRVASKTSMLTLVYSDTAGGINPAKLRYPDPRFASRSVDKSVFEKGVTSKKYGTGLGMWIARQIIRRHHGSIELRDYRHGGVTFVIRIPRNLLELISREKV